ncbi:MAG: hypothetical protein KDD89_15080, partial [Anaerolineales bacterium]|nr:hypothetical protein [Anaerolineales bacterium]
MSLVRPLFIMLLSLLVLILVACGGAEPASPEPAVTDPTAVPAPPTTEPIELPDVPTAVPPTETAETAPTTAPEPTPTAVPANTNLPADIAEASFSGVSFFYDRNLIANQTSAFVPAVAGTYGLPPDGPRLFFYDVPDYIKFDLQAAGDPATTWPAHLAIQPYTNAEGNVYSGYEEWDFERDRLAAFAADMSQPITAVGSNNGIQAAPLTFSNGSGLRYLDILPPGPGLPTVTNDELYYVFNGFTADNRYFVYLQFPVSHPDLPSLDSIDFEALDAQYQAGTDPETLFAEELARLSEADASSFTPPLDQLDSMVSTLFVPAEASTVSSIPRVDLTTCTPDVSFVEDITIPDGSPVEPNTVFTKTWRIINDGTCPITAAFEYFPVGESAIRPHSYNIRVPLTLPGETMDVSVPLVS